MKLIKLVVTLYLSSCFHLHEALRVKVRSLGFRPLTSLEDELTKSSVNQMTPIQNSSPTLISYKAASFQTLKLPVWPVWGGVIAQIFDWMQLPALAELTVNTFGGRVVPMQLSEFRTQETNQQQLSPFLLLVHHTHSFTPFDPVRAITRLLLPEGFPAHPHSGFDTVTYCIEGGLRHRDSEGISMDYGDGDVQWMRAGRGVIHEEMWNIPNPWQHKKIEIFQLWVNLPQRMKTDHPQVRLLRDKDLMEVPCGHQGKGKLRIICGDVDVEEGFDEKKGEKCESRQYEGAGNDVVGSPASILHLKVPKNERIEIEMQRLNSDHGPFSALLYVRRGTFLSDASDGILRQGNVATFSPSDSTPSHAGASFHVSAGKEGLDALLLLGEPLQEPQIFRGPYVHSNMEDMERSITAFSSIPIENGGFWDYRLTHEEWLDHIKNLNLQNVLNQFYN